MQRTGQKSRSQFAFGPHVFAIEGLCCVELFPRASYEATYTPVAPVIGFAFEAQTGMHAFASSRKVAFRAKPNHLSFVPTNCDVYSQSSRGGEYLKNALEPGVAKQRKMSQRFSNVIDAPAIAAAYRLRRQLIVHTSLDPLAARSSSATCSMSAPLNARAWPKRSMGYAAAYC